jgi:RNA polymerase sigma-70 factor, ECF subfamily
MLSADPNTDLTEAYLRLLSEHDRWLAGYVFSLVPRAADADDLQQEVKLTLWRHFAKFERGSNFKAWARQIATHAVLNHRRAEKKRAHPELDDAFIEAIAAEMDQRSAHVDDRADALQHCLQKLPENQRRLIVWRYQDDCGIDEIALKTQRSPEAVYKLLSRIRSALNDCITQRLARA